MNVNFVTVPQWAWIVLGLGVLLFAIRTGWLANLLKRPATGTADLVTGTTPGMSLLPLDSLQGYKTKLAALIIALLAANELWHFIPDPYVSVIVYLASALGLYGLRDAVERLKQRLDQTPTKT